MTTATTIAAPRIVSHSPPPATPAPMPTRARPLSAMSMPITPTTTRVVVLSMCASPGLLGRRRWRGGVRLDDHRGAVGDDLGHRAGQLRAVEAHRDHRVRAHQRRVLDHPVEGLAAGVLEERRVLLDLAA